METIEELFKKEKNFRRKIDTAEAQKLVREQQLEEIAPQKKKIEAEVKQNLKCSIKDLPEKQKLLMAAMAEVVAELERDFAEQTGTEGDDD